MELKEHELKVFYYGENIRDRLDKALEECLKKFGYKRLVSGYDLDDKVRDLFFDKKGD